MMEWTIDYGSNLAGKVRVTTNMTCLAVVSPRAGKLFDEPQPLLPGFHVPTNGSGARDMAVVLVQEFRDMFHIPLSESFYK